MSFPKFCLLKNWGFGNLALGKILLPYVRIRVWYITVIKEGKPNLQPLAAGFLPTR
jgi:hypothetical protein